MTDTQVIIALIAAVPIAFGGWLTYLAKKRDRLANREERLEDRVDAMERKLDNVRRYLRREQAFSHRLVLAMHGVVAYLRAVAVYRARHQESLPDGLPDLPDADTLENLILERPTYDDPD